ncbi:MAG: HEAT repeat domain-containing protein [Planctomycetes bacterium]|nr:HEAT repeat domain-containing protein [Planctomycetota bacterium]
MVRVALMRHGSDLAAALRVVLSVLMVPFALSVPLVALAVFYPPFYVYLRELFGRPAQALAGGGALGQVLGRMAWPPGGGGAGAVLPARLAAVLGTEAPSVERALDLDALRGAEPADPARLVELARDASHPEVRASALARLGTARPGTPATARALLDGLGDESPLVRRAAVQSLAALGPAEGGAVRGALTDGDPAVRAAALGVVAGWGDEDAPAVVARGLVDPEPRVRQSAARALAGLDPATPAAREVARSALGPLAAPEALALLGRGGDPDDLPLALDHLEDADPRARVQALLAARRLAATEGALPHLFEALHTGEPALRSRALEVLADRHPGPAAPSVLASFSDAAAEVRRTAARAAASARVPGAEGPLVELLGDGDPSVVVAAADALAELRAAPAAAPLRGLLSHGSPQVRSAARRALDLLARAPR